MKKILVALTLVTMLTFAGCGSKPNPVGNMSEVNQCLAGAPEWVITGGMEGGLSAVGASQIGKAGIQFARTAALGNARDEMARIINVKVNNMLKDFTQTTGIGDNEVVDKVTATVSKQVASEELQGATQRAVWTSPCNELYVLISIDPSAVQSSVKNSVATSYKNENALWQQFQAQKAQDELDAAISSEFK